MNAPKSVPTPVDGLLLTVEQVCSLLHCSRFTVDKLIGTGAVRYMRSGKRNLIHRADLLAYIERTCRREGSR